MNEDKIGIHSEVVGNKMVVYVQGNLDVHNTHKIEKDLMAIVGAAGKPVIFNLSDVPFISSAGLRLLVTTLRLCQEQKISISICGLQPAVEKVFDIIGMQQLFTIYPDLDSALQ
ncbi:STAS domain-containing protein [Leptospira kanakyensis]|uniref:Anti-sigma factor antagonist n=1 Tax=Leptospira kanakyensis TaxID=2484968 RepID=A0A6N4QHM0_9LEPT|nr:STAS domain-containing protein [Leptospira kanakyensis]MCW7470610.1 STAS domain-containing protein [Leptospira kanakyensis]MCW7481675.1 STAS domain-containing protein [Leptospira kanakyensis]TGK53791.1 anti-sigma factor antagonist [Leptospira kanakyensis]TGK57586.1 anti-sigma factor antagonist [Leptospira kanakyensis]TGK73296.1 anti-sigma factor antagonist [Leptospira kanakyensis]